jgi:hypothetical protein
MAAAPWQENHVNLIYPWNVTVKGVVAVDFLALTVIDPVTNIVDSR